MPASDFIFAHIVPFMLVLFRLSGLFVFAPMLGGSLIPMRIRALMVFMFTLALYPTLARASVPMLPVVPSLDLFTLIPLAVCETLIGLGIGLIAALPMYAVQLGGLVAGQQLGLGLAGVYNPALDTESDVIGQMLMYVALAIFAAAGGLELAFVALGKTFSHLPIGGMGVVNAGLGDLLVGLISSGFGLALRVSAPVMAIILLETLASAFLMKTIPQINIMSLGFAIKIVLGVFVLVISIGAIGEAIGDDVKQTCEAVVRWAGGG